MSGLLLIISLSIVAFAVAKLITGMKKSLYRYENITRLGLVIFLSVFIIWDTVTFINDLKAGYPPSVLIMVMDIKSSVALFMMYMFPVAFMVSILVAASQEVQETQHAAHWPRPCPPPGAPDWVPQLSAGSSPLPAVVASPAKSQLPSPCLKFKTSKFCSGNQ